MVFTVLETHSEMDVTNLPIFLHVRACFNTQCETVAVIFIFQLKGFTFIEPRLRVLKV